MDQLLVIADFWVLLFFNTFFFNTWVSDIAFQNVLAANSDFDWFTLFPGIISQNLSRNIAFQKYLCCQIWLWLISIWTGIVCKNLADTFQWTSNQTMSWFDRNFVINWFQISWLCYKKDIAISKYITFNLSVYPLISSTKRSTSARVRARQWPEVSDFVAHFARCKNTLPCENSKSFLKRKKVALGHCLIRAYMQQHTRKCTFT